MKLIGGLLLALTFLLAACVGGRHTDASGIAARNDRQAQGQKQFRISCAGCHGNDARGTGPIAPLLSVAVPDLTLIAARHGQFPGDEIFRIVDGQADLSAHGPRHMPIWGYEFFGNAPDDEAAHREATQKIDLVVNYLRSIQRAP